MFYSLACVIRVPRWYGKGQSNEKFHKAACANGPAGTLGWNSVCKRCPYILQPGILPQPTCAGVISKFYIVNVLSCELQLELFKLVPFSLKMRKLRALFLQLQRVLVFISQVWNKDFWIILHVRTVLLDAGNTQGWEVLSLELSVQQTGQLRWGMPSGGSNSQQRAYESADTRHGQRVTDCFHVAGALWVRTDGVMSRRGRLEPNLERWPGFVSVGRWEGLVWKTQGSRDCCDVVAVFAQESPWLWSAYFHKWFFNVKCCWRLLGCSYWHG